MRAPLSGRLCGLTAIAALIAGMTGCSSTKDATTSANLGQPPVSGRGALTWIFAQRALSDVRVDPAVRAQLGQARVFELARFHRRPHSGSGLVPTVKFASYAAMKETLDNGALPPWIEAVLYDNEAWSFTPAAEQRSPGLYTAMAAKLAHQHHLLFVASPALDLTNVVARQSGPSQKAAAYLEMHLAGQAADAADVLNIQAQSLERSTTAYVDFVRKAAAQARQAKPGITVLAGISSNPTGPQVTAAQLMRAITGVRPYVDGYWMNIPSPGPACPRCNPARPDLAIAAIQSLSR
jgi:hypothetical protein